MSTMTIRLPEDRHARLRHLAKSRGVSLNRLMDELATAAIAQHDASIRFEVRAARGSKAEGLKLLNKLDRAFKRGR